MAVVRTFSSPPTAMVSAKRTLPTSRSDSVVLLDHLTRPLQEHRRDRQAEGLGGLEIDDEFELGGLLNGQIGYLHSMQ